MIGTTVRQPSLFYLAFGKQASLIKDDLLDPLDQLLDDAELVQTVREALERRCPHSRRTGRKGMAPDRLLRCCVLKHLKGWSFRELERELRSSLLYRRFTRFDDDPIPDYSVFCRSFALLSPNQIQQIHGHIVSTARQKGVARGRKLRTDTTVVESNIHFPTDSSLLLDGIRVLTRCAKRIAESCRKGNVAESCRKGNVKVVDHQRAAKRRLYEIEQASKSFTDVSRLRMRESYQKLMALTRKVVRQAQTVLSSRQRGELPIEGSSAQVLRDEVHIRHFIPLIQKVLTQTRARVLEGDTHHPDKIVSLFEEHTAVLRKGKKAKPTEFGRLVRVDEVEGGIVSQYEVLDGNPGDQTALLPAVEQHVEIYGRAPQLVAADRGFFSAHNEREAKKLGVQKVAIPARGRLSKTRAKRQKERWFRRASKWRAAVESRIGILKHPFGMLRATYKGDRGFKRHVGWCVLTQNLVSIARYQVRKARWPA